MGGIAEGGAMRAALVAVLCFATSASAFGFRVQPHATECFEEHASASDHVSGQWTLTMDHKEAPHASLEGWKVKVTSPSGDSVYHSESEHEGAFDYYATAEGVYVVCFANGADRVADATAKITVGDPPDLIQLAKTEHLTPIEERIKNLHESMNAVRDLQDEIREQDEAQAKMTLSTRTWLLYLTFIEAAVLVGVTAWQNLYLKSFFEVKRVV